MNLFSYLEYRKYLTERIQAMPSRGRGVLGKLATALKIHPSRLSQILKGPTHLTPEQALLAAKFFGLDAVELDYFITLVNLERAGTAELRAFYVEHLDRLRGESRQISQLVPREKKLTPEDQAQFYSHWAYSGVRLLSSIPGYDSLDAFARYFRIPATQARMILEFLLKTGLCVETNGKVTMGAKSTHLPASSVFVSRHHMNWRMKAMERHDRLSDSELAYSGPMSISARDQEEIRTLLLQTIQKSVKTAIASEPEKLCVLNVDWIEF